MKGTQTIPGTQFVVAYVYYWYNTGAADNGNYEGRQRFSSLEEAEAFYRRIVPLCQRGAGLEELDEVAGTTYGRASGFLEKTYHPVLYRITTEAVPVRS